MKNLLLFLIVMFIVSCTKKEDVNLSIKNGSNMVDTILIIGHVSDSLTYTPLDKILEIERPDFNNYETETDGYFPLDIDKDEQIDLRFHSNWFATKWGDAVTLNIEIINSDFEISSLTINDTTLRCCYSIEPDSFIIFYSSYSDFICFNSQGSSVFDITSKEYSKFYKLGDSINRNANWQIGEEILNIAYFEDQYGIETSAGFYYYNKREFGARPCTNSKYIVFKKKDDNSYKFGWIRFSLFDLLTLRIDEYVFEE